MFIIPIAWLYVALMMAVAEATSSTGTVLGAIVTFVLYGLGPVLLVLYLMGTPGRRKAIKAREAAEVTEAAAVLATGEADGAPTHATDPSLPPDASRHAPGTEAPMGVTPVRKEP